jgi:uncharacterized cupin superfamily protein
MVKKFKIAELPLEERIAQVPEFTWKTSPRLAKIADSKHFQMDIRSLDAGKFSFPYHFHRAAEELFLFLEGAATLRAPEGFIPVEKGDILFFQTGPEGAHQLYNHSDAPCLYLDLRTTIGIDIAEYPDSDKVVIIPSQEIFDASAKSSYFQGEEAVAEKWPPEILRP